MEPAKPPDKTTAVIQGDYKISNDPNEVLSTILGSCVAVCMHDPVSKLGGMNHFLLPFGRDDANEKPVRYGFYAMEVMINSLLKRGAVKSRLQAKVFGGARISADLRDVGKSNATFAREFLANESILVLGESLGGNRARRVIFRPATGQAKMLIIPATELPRTIVDVPPPKPAAAADIELF